MTARSPFTSVGTEADHSLERTTASRPSSTAVTTAVAVTIAVTGTWPFRKPIAARLADEGIDLPFDVSHGQSCDAGRVLNGDEAIAWWVHDTECSVGMVERECVDRDDGIDAAPEGDQRPTRSRCVRRRGGVGQGGADDAEPPEVDAVAEGEFGEAVDVVLGQERPLEGGGREVAEVDDGRCRGLVVRDAGHEVEETGGCPHGRVGPVTPW